MWVCRADGEKREWRNWQMRWNIGAYDGEGTMFGEWRIGPFRDQWAITFKKPQGTAAVAENVQVIG